MKVLDRTINAWQMGILIFVLMLANKILVLPSLLFEKANIESLFLLFFFFALELGVLFLFQKLKEKFPAERFDQILQNHFGKTVRVIFYVAFMIFFLSKAVLLYNVTYIFFRNLIYKDTSNVLILFCFLPVICHLAICGLRVLGRTMQIFFPIVLTILIFCLIVGVFGINSRVIWFQTPFLEIIKTGAEHISPFGDMIFLFLIMDRVEIKKGQWAIPYTFFALSSIIVIAVALVFMLSFTYTSFMHPYAIFEIVSFIKEFGGLGRIDIIAMVAIIMLAYFHLAIYLKAFMFAFEGVFSKIDKIFSVITFVFAFVIVVNFFIINLETAVVFGEKILPFALIFPYFILPIFVAILLFWKEKKTNETKAFRNDFQSKKNQKMRKNAANLQQKENLILKDSKKFAQKMPQIHEKFDFSFKNRAKNKQKQEKDAENLQKKEEKSLNFEKFEKQKILKKPQKTAFFAQKINFKAKEVEQ